jgi:hypothetical protein
MATIRKKQAKSVKAIDAPARPVPRIALPAPDAPNYFEELLKRVQEIRVSEKRFYLQVTDIYATSVDYEKQSEATLAFFATVQNKLHYSVTGKTAAEIIVRRADASAPHMGLTTWKGNKVCKTDVCVAKNYLAAEELEKLARIVTMYLDYAKDQAERHKHMRMADWKTKLDEFLRFYDRKVLTGKGSISAERAKKMVERQYKLFDERRRAEKARLVGETRPKPKRLGRGK